MDKIKRDVFLLEDEKVYNKLDEIVEWIKNISERIGRMEDEYKEHLYGAGYSKKDHYLQ